MDLAHQLCVPNGPYSKSQVARALGISRGALYPRSKQARTDKQEAVAVELWYKLDDTQELCKTEVTMIDPVHPRRTHPKKRPVVIPALPWRLLLLMSYLLIIGIPAFLLGTRMGQRVLPTLTNYFYNSSGTPPLPTPTPLPPFPTTVPQPGSLLYTAQPGDSCDEILSVQMHMTDAGQIFSDANTNTVKALNNAVGQDCHVLQPGMVIKLSPHYPLVALGGVVLKVEATSPQQPLPTPLITVTSQQQAGFDCSTGCLLTIRIAPGTQIRLLVQTALPVHIGSWVWAQAMLARKQIAGFANYPYADPNASLNGMLLRACDLQVDNTHDDNSLSCSQLLPNTIVDDGGAWLFGVTGPGSLDHWRYPLHLPSGSRVLLWLSVDSHGDLKFQKGNPVYRYNETAHLYVPG